MLALGRPTARPGVIRDMQSGSVQRYCIWFLGGALGLTILLASNLLIRSEL